MDLDSLLTFANNHKLAIAITLLLLEQGAFLLPAHFLYEKGITLGKYRVGNIPTFFTDKYVDGLKITFIGDRLYIRLGRPDVLGVIPLIIPPLFVGYIINNGFDDNNEDGYFYVKMGPITFTLAVFFATYLIYSKGIEGFWLALYASLIASAYYIYLKITVVHVMKTRKDWD